MKKYLFLLFSFCCYNAFSQASGDAKLDKRLNEYIELNMKLDFAKMMDYMHPSLFSMAPKETVLATFELAFNLDEMKITIDTMYVTGVGGAKRFGDADYRKIDFFMAMDIVFTDATLEFNDEFVEKMNKSMAQGFPGKKVSFNKERKLFTVSGADIMFAIKDKGSKVWMFLGADKSNPQLIEMLYPEEVIKYFRIL